MGPEQYASVNVMSCVAPFIDTVTVFRLGVLLSVGASAGAVDASAEGGSAGVVEVSADDSDSGTTSGEAEQPVNNSSVTKLRVMVRLFTKVLYRWSPGSPKLPPRSLPRPFKLSPVS